MTKIAFLTDIHLDCLSNQGLNDFLSACTDPSIDYYLISGDIGTAPNVVSFLRVMEDAWQKPIVFCLGNHDFWHGSIKGVRDQIKKVTGEWPMRLFSVSDRYYTALNETTAVVGHDGWYDGLHGDAKNSRFLMNDWWNIKEFAEAVGPLNRFGPRLDLAGKMRVIELSQKLASDAATHVNVGIKAAASQGFTNIIVLTHVPPWQEAHVHEGRPGGDEAAPWFTSKIMGNMLEKTALANPDVNFTVLCGHTHGRVDVKVAENLTCRVGGADYTSPRIQFVMEV